MPFALGSFIWTVKVSTFGQHTSSNSGHYRLADTRLSQGSQATTFAEQEMDGL